MTRSWPRLTFLLSQHDAADGDYQEPENWGRESAPVEERAGAEGRVSLSLTRTDWSDSALTDLEIVSLPGRRGAHRASRTRNDGWILVRIGRRRVRRRWTTRAGLGRLGGEFSWTRNSPNQMPMLLTTGMALYTRPGAPHWRFPTTFDPPPRRTYHHRLLPLNGRIIYLVLYPAILYRLSFSSPLLTYIQPSLGLPFRRSAAGTKAFGDGRFLLASDTFLSVPMNVLEFRSNAVYPGHDRLQSRE